MAKSAPDGYTMHKNLSWDLLRDFAPVGRYVSSPMVVVVNDKLPVKSLRELIDYAKANPGKLNFGSAGSGTAPHLVGEQFALQTGMKMVHVPYKGSAPSVTGLLADEVQMSFAASSSVDAFIKDGRLKPLAVTTARRDPQYPDLPTIAEAGVPGFDADIRTASSCQPRRPRTSSRNFFPHRARGCEAIHRPPRCGPLDFAPCARLENVGERHGQP